MSHKYLKYKYRQAAANLAKQPKNPYNFKMDPLSLICQERLKIIKKSKCPRQTNQLSLYPKNQQTQEKKKTRHIKKQKKAKHITYEKQCKPQQYWSKYLPQECDEFGEKEPSNNNENFQNLQINQTQKKEIQMKMENKMIDQIKPMEQMFPPKCQNQMNDVQFNIDELKIKLGIGIKENIAEQAQQKCEQIKLENQKQSPEAALLLFDGRPFVQAPPRPAPKKIYEYPPTCKVAGLYPWPPPKSQWRSWKAQMKQSRKLN